VFQQRTQFIKTYLQQNNSRNQVINILIVKVKQTNVVSKEQQLLSIFASQTVPSVCVELSGCIEKLLAGYTSRRSRQILFSAGSTVLVTGTGCSASNRIRLSILGHEVDSIKLRKLASWCYLNRQHDQNSGCRGCPITLTESHLLQLRLAMR